MIVTLDHRTWAILRYIVRASKQKQFNGVRGKELRLDMNRKTKDGTFLSGLVTLGLIREMTGDGSNTHGEERWPEPFRKWYGLTSLGEHAAEYGEYDKPYISKRGP